MCRSNGQRAFVSSTTHLTTTMLRGLTAAAGREHLLPKVAHLAGTGCATRTLSSLQALAIAAGCGRSDGLQMGLKGTCGMGEIGYCWRRCSMMRVRECCRLNVIVCNNAKQLRRMGYFCSTRWTIAPVRTPGGRAPHITHPRVL